jgi:hypothetical protein
MQEVAFGLSPKMSKSCEFLRKEDSKQGVANKKTYTETNFRFIRNVKKS